MDTDDIITLSLADNAASSESGSCDNFGHTHESTEVLLANDAVRAWEVPDDAVRAWEVPDDDCVYCIFCRDMGNWTPRCPYVGVWTTDDRDSTGAHPVGTLVAIVPSEDASVCTVVDLDVSVHKRAPRPRTTAATAVSRWRTDQLTPLVRRRAGAPCLGRESRQVAAWVSSMCVKLCRAHVGRPDVFSQI
jgi:hypothetical protein